jgi:uncharacterized glyoxalase superfamily protein PhnB
MTDPLDVLREPTRPVDPDPTFARDLRARLERALLDPISSATEDPTMPTTPTAAPTAALPLHALTPYLAVTDARAAVDFYVEAFGARRRDDPIVMPDGRIGHVEVALGESVLMLADEFPEANLLAPATRGGPSQSLHLEVADPDEVVERAVRLGATLERPVADHPYGRNGVVVDPAGHRWMVSRSAPAPARPGEVVYASLWTPDVGRAERFYGEVLGWVAEPGSGPQGRQVGRHLGMWGGQRHATVLLCYTVADVDAAAEVVRAAGGSAEEPSDEEYGRVANCVDDQGIPFALMSGVAGSPVSELAHVTLRVPDAVRARAFYATVLGWGFTPADMADGWRARIGSTEPRPRVTVEGGQPTAVVVPTFVVADLAGALAAVHAAGGRSSGTEQRHYGPAANCVDDQGAPFQLLQG